MNPCLVLRRTGSSLAEVFGWTGLDGKSFVVERSCAVDGMDGRRSGCCSGRRRKGEDADEIQSLQATAGQETSDTRHKNDDCYATHANSASDPSHWHTSRAISFHF